MITIINYIRQMFCKHDFLIEEGHVKSDGFLKSGTKVYMRCKKCGWHTKHWKYV